MQWKVNVDVIVPKNGEFQLGFCIIAKYVLELRERGIESVVECFIYSSRT